MNSTAGTVGEVEAVLEQAYPLAWAEDWDVVGRTVGGAGDPASSALLAVDVTAAVLGEAVERGADLIVAHHPLLLRGIDRADTDQPAAALLAGLLRARIAVVVAHTNADVAPGGVVDALADAVGMSAERRPLRPRPVEPLDTLVTFVPPTHHERVVDALSAAGAGAVGAYDRCWFAVTGTGSFRPLTGAAPFAGRIGEVEQLPETRLELVVPRKVRGQVVAALHAAHPYETPAYHLVEHPGTASADTGLGRVGELREPATLAEFAERVAAALPRTGGGLRIAGDPARPIRTVAVQAGAGDDLLTEATRSGADVYLTSDLRHHPASGALAAAGAPALIDVAHWAAEWTWLPVLQRLLAEQLPGLVTHVSTLCTDPWTDHGPHRLTPGGDRPAAG